MNRIVLVSLFILTANHSFAQDATVVDLKKQSEITIKKDPKDTLNLTWKNGGTFNLNVNQGSLSNWAAGGDKFSFSLNAYMNLYSYYKKNKNAWDNNLDMAYGIVKTTSLGRRKSSDRIDLTSKYGYALNKKWNLSTLFNLRSQFANGYNYEKDASGNDIRTLTSKTFAPAYVLLSLGLDYRPVSNFSLFLSPMTGRWVVVGDTSLGKLYSLAPGKKVKSELGAFLSANYTGKIGKNFTYKTKLDLFSNYRQHPENIDIYWTNVITAKITKYFNFSFNLDMIYDDDVKNVEPDKGPAPQWLQLMGIGFAYKFGTAAKVK